MVFLPCIRIHNNQILRLLQESLFAIFLFFADLRIWSHLLISWGMVFTSSLSSSFAEKYHSKYQSTSAVWIWPYLPGCPSGRSGIACVVFFNMLHTKPSKFWMLFSAIWHRKSKYTKKSLTEQDIYCNYCLYLLLCCD